MVDRAGFEPATFRCLDTPGLYATKLRYGGHKEPPICRGICKFPRGRFYETGLQWRGSWKRPFKVSFVTPIHPFFQYGICPFSMNMHDEMVCRHQCLSNPSLEGVKILAKVLWNPGTSNTGSD